MAGTLSDEQVQELTNTIADKCEAMELDAEQILDGIARSLIAAATTFGTKELLVDIEGHGTCEVKIISQ